MVVPVRRWPGLPRRCLGRVSDPGRLCTVCRTTDRQQPQVAERAVTAAEAAEANGNLSRLRRGQPLAKPGRSLVAGLRGRGIGCVGE